MPTFTASSFVPRSYVWDVGILALLLGVSFLPLVFLIIPGVEMAEIGFRVSPGVSHSLLPLWHQLWQSFQRHGALSYLWLILPAPSLLRGPVSWDSLLEGLPFCPMGIVMVTGLSL